MLQGSCPQAWKRIRAPWNFTAKGNWQAVATPQGEGEPTKRAKASDVRGSWGPRPCFTRVNQHMENFHVRFVLPDLCSLFHSCLLSSPGGWMPTTSVMSPPAVSVACIPCGTCGWMTTLWQKSLSRLSEVYQHCRPWPWPWTKYTTYQTMPLETSPAW